MKKTMVIQLFTVGILFTISGGCEKNKATPKKTPEIVWEQPGDIGDDTPLSSLQLNATSGIPGTFVYTPEIGTLLKVGLAQELKVDFTPNDTENYTTASKTIKINVFKFGTVTDYDGNTYKTITIGNQTWMAENLKSLHYSDGTPISGVASYSNSNEIAEKHGRLYTWDATMRNSTTEGAQGVAPDGWHIPTDNEWKELENYLGGKNIAGGKLKSMNEWKAPNTNATNSSGFSALPSGEYDANEFLKYHLLGKYGRERYLSFDDAKSSTYDWYKIMKYSVRCIKD